MARLFSVSGCAAAAIAMQCSGSVAAVIGGNVIAAQPARPKLVANNDATLTGAISRAPKVDKTIATVSRSIDDAGRGLHA